MAVSLAWHGGSKRCCMDELFTQILTLIFGGLLGVMIKNWYDYKAMVYKSLWEKRYETYKRMFRITGILPLYPRKADVTYERLIESSEEMRDWYFEEGGLLLSEKARDFYFDVQRKIRDVISDRAKETMTQPITDDYETIQRKFSALRKEMTNDLMSRSRIRGLLGSRGSKA